MTSKYTARWLPLLLLIPAIAWAGHATPGYDASMVVTGTVEVGPDGHVLDYQIDHSKELPPVARTIMAKSVPHWTFAPVLVDGKPVIAKSRMQVRLLATPNRNGAFDVRVASAWFGSRKDRAKDSSLLRYKQHAPPRYPTSMVYARFSGTVYLVLRIASDGTVDQAAVRQVNLTARGRPADMRRARKIFARASMNTAKRWTFNVPTTGLAAHQDHWTAVIPIKFKLHGRPGSEPVRKYGRWIAFLPGPEHAVPWLHNNQKHLLANSSALTGGIHLLGAKQQLQLRTPLDGGS